MLGDCGSEITKLELVGDAGEKTGGVIGVTLLTVALFPTVSVRNDSSLKKAHIGNVFAPAPDFVLILFLFIAFRKFARNFVHKFDK